MRRELETLRHEAKSSRHCGERRVHPEMRYLGAGTSWGGKLSLRTKELREWPESTLEPCEDLSTHPQARLLSCGSATRLIRSQQHAPGVWTALTRIP
eukprot:5844609-Prymnesium_polylepis.1